QQAELAARHEALAMEAERLARTLAAARLAELLGDRERDLPAWERAEEARSRARERLRSLDGTVAAADAERSSTDELAAAAGAAPRSVLDGELAECEAAFRVAEQARRDAEDERRLQREDSAARRAEHETLRRALTGHEEELERLRRARREVRAMFDEASARAHALESEIERLDTEETPLATEHADLEARRSTLAAGLADARVQEQGLRARLDVLHARREELAESPAASFAKRRGNRPIGILADLVRCPPHLTAALRGALGPFPDAVVSARGAQASA